MEFLNYISFSEKKRKLKDAKKEFKQNFMKSLSMKS